MILLFFNCISNIASDKFDEKYFLVVARLSEYKKIDVIVETFNKIGLPLLVVGEGKHEKYLKKTIYSQKTYTLFTKGVTVLFGHFSFDKFI